MTSKTCCVIGDNSREFLQKHREKRFHLQKDYLNSITFQIENLIKENQVNNFISSGTIGFDMDVSEILINLRDNLFPDITFELSILSCDDDFEWSQSDKERYAKIIIGADQLHFFKGIDKKTLLSKNVKHMLNNSSFILVPDTFLKNIDFIDTINFFNIKQDNIITIKMS